MAAGAWLLHIEANGAGGAANGFVQADFQRMLDIVRHGTEAHVGCPAAMQELLDEVGEAFEAEGHLGAPVRAVEALAILLAHPLIGLPLLAVAVVGGALLGVREHLIRLVNLFELLLGLLIAGVHIGVILACQLAIRRLDFFLGGVAWHAQYRIVVFEAPHAVSPQV
jgi:hypothetical protein